MSARLKVAVVHYHFKPGGVTRVVESTLAGFESIPEEVQFAFISGAPEYDADSAASIVLPELGYSAPGQELNPEELYFKLLAAARETLGALPDVWHIHNHSLGKNKAFSGVVQRLAADGRPILLHVHDFAEDGRPSNYAHIREGLESDDALYPIGEHIHYDFLNGRDFNIMLDAGVPDEQIHLLPNPISVEDSEKNHTPPQNFSPFPGRNRLFLYPVRAVRRKNLGELAFWAAVAPKDALLANTLGPSNPNFRPAFDRWIKRCAEWKLPVRFELGVHTQAAFSDMVNSAEAMVTTSVAEGFGLGFLEPWTFNKPLIGRDLADITKDFKTAGIDLEHLYQRLPIPLDFIEDKDALDKELREKFTAQYKQYDQALPINCFEAVMEAWVQDDCIDFGVLSEPFQEAIIARVIREKPTWAMEAGEAFFNVDQVVEKISANRSKIEGLFTTKNYAQQLFEIYKTVSSAPTERVLKHLEPQAVLSNFLSPERFNLLRSS